LSASRSWPGTPFAAVRVKNGIDATSVEGAANLPYAVPNMAVELNTTETGVPVLWWRVVGSSHTAYATETFIDEIAHAAGKDPFAFHQAMLEHHPRHKAARRGHLSTISLCENTIPRMRGAIACGHAGCVKPEGARATFLRSPRWRVPPSMHPHFWH
jgi:hypothetical protein